MTPVKTIPITDLPIWEDARKDRSLLTLTLELTTRCNNNCTHCYINISASDENIQAREMNLPQIRNIVDQAVELGTLWIILSGGEPLLRPDFPEIYTYIRKKGLLVSLLTNASLVTQAHIDLFKKHPPRDIEVTVYGVKQKTHRQVTRAATFQKTLDGINLLYENNLPVTLKSTITRSNMNEIDEISEFCRSKTRQPFRFDPVLHFRMDNDPVRNQQISSQRLSPDEIYEIEKNDPVRSNALSRRCANADHPKSNPDSAKLFTCMAGINSGCIDADGFFKLCSCFKHPDYVYDLKKNQLTQAWYDFTPKIITLKSDKTDFIASCGTCSHLDVCAWCPAHAWLETGKLTGQTPYFCQVAEKRNSLKTLTTEDA